MNLREEFLKLLGKWIRTFLEEKIFKKNTKPNLNPTPILKCVKNIWSFLNKNKELIPIFSIPPSIYLMYLYSLYIFWLIFRYRNRKECHLYLKKLLIDIYDEVDSNSAAIKMFKCPDQRTKYKRDVEKDL